MVIASRAAYWTNMQPPPNIIGTSVLTHELDVTISGCNETSLFKSSKDVLGLSHSSSGFLKHLHKKFAIILVLQ